MRHASSPGAGGRGWRSDALRDVNLSTRVAVLGRAWFLVLVLADVGAHSLAEPGFPLQPAVVTAGAIIFLGSVVAAAAVAVPRRGSVRLSPGLLLGITAADFVALGLLQVASSDYSFALVALLPAFWVGYALSQVGPHPVPLAVPFAFVLPELLLRPQLASLVELAVVQLILITLVGIIALGIRAAQRERRAFLRHRSVSDAVFNGVDIGLVLLNADGSYESINPHHRAFLDLAYPDGHRGRAGQAGLVYHEDGLTPIASYDMPTARASRQEEFGDYRIWVGAGEEMRALSVSAKSVRDERGKFVGAVLAYKDITHVMQALAVRDDFVALVSHELRTPLTSIIGYLDVILDRSEGLDDDNVAHLLVVQRNAQRLLKLVSDLLHTAAAEKGQLQIAPTGCDLGALVREAVDELGSYAASHRVELVVSIEQVPELQLDHMRLSQVVHNLVTNAIKYSHPGDRVGVSVYLAGDDVVLAVADEGIGMSPEDVRRVFTKFFRTRKVAERAIQGVGLGLPITKAIVEAHGGRIEVESEEGVGTTMRVVLPVRTVVSPVPLVART